VFSGLGAGSYEVYILDQWGCDLLVGPVVLTDAMTATSAVIKPIDCTINPEGEITITVNGGSSNLDYTVTYPDLTTTVSQNNGVFINLSQAGEYVFVITDLDTATPCTYEVRQTLDAPVNPILLDAVIENISCFGGSDGSLTAVLDAATATNPGYTYELYRTSDLVTPIRAAQASPLFENLDADSYQVRVISARSCEDIKVEVVSEPNALTASATATDFACATDNSVNTSTIDVTAVDGTAPYLYSFDGNGFDSSNTYSVIDNGAAQTINYIVRDANGCEFTDNITIQPLNTFNASIAVNTDITCVNPENITITVSESFPTGHTYTFELLPTGNPNGAIVSSTSTSAVFNLTAPNTYNFRVNNDVTGCYVDVAHIINPFDLIDVAATATAPVTCFGDTNGELEVIINDYVGSFGYEVFDQNNTSVQTNTGISNGNPFTFTVSGLSGGNYYVRVTETGAGSSLCADDTNVVNIASPDMALTAIVNPVAPATCDNDRGEILVDPSGGYAPYDITLMNNTTSVVTQIDDVNSHIFIGLSAATYSIRIVDANGCELLDSETLNAPTPIITDINASTSMLECNGDSNASVFADLPTGGSGEYLYVLNEYANFGDTTPVFTSGAQSSLTFNNLGAGVYSITVVDGWNCDVTTNQVQIDEPTEVMPNLVQSAQMTCTTGAELILTATDGTAPYFYYNDATSTWDPFNNGSSHRFSNVVPGDYQFVVRDANDCEVPLSNQITVDPVPPLTIVIDDSAAFINCTGEASATIIANVTGGLGNYSYELYGDVGLTNLITGPQSNNTFSGLPAGSYFVRVTSQDCEEVSTETLIVDPVPLQIDREEFTNVTCFGLDDGSITVEVSGGTGEIQYAISPNLNQFDSLNTFTDLSPGDYTVVAQDQNGCFEQLQYTITEPAVLTVDATATPEICVDSRDGTITLDITGGTAPYSTAMNSNDDADFVVNQMDFVDMAAGNYLIFVRDANGCEANVVIDVEVGVNLNATVEPIYECSGDTPDNYLNITLEDPSVIGEVLYALDSMDSAAMQLNPDFRNIAPGDHFITIAHENGCIQTVDFTIEAFEPLTLVLEQRDMNEITAITDGGAEPYTYYFDGRDNGEDSTFYITRTDTYEVIVVDENGCEAVATIFMEFIDIEIPNFFTPDGDGNNDFWIPRNMEQFPEILIKIFDRYGRVVSEQTHDAEGWDGKYAGKELPTGDYWYVIQLNGTEDDREFVGHFTLYR
jgi:gliding motility-associated-like protein